MLLEHYCVLSSEVLRVERYFVKITVTAYWDSDNRSVTFADDPSILTECFVSRCFSNDNRPMTNDVVHNKGGRDVNFNT